MQVEGEGISDLQIARKGSDTRELIARIRARLPVDLQALGSDLRLNRKSHSVIRRLDHSLAAPFPLQPLEYEVLETLVDANGAVVGTWDLYERVFEARGDGWDGEAAPPPSRTTRTASGSVSPTSDASSARTMFTNTWRPSTASAIAFGRNESRQRAPMLPVVYLDVLLFTVLLIVVLVVGALVGWWLHRRRADHALDNDITAIQGHLAVLGQELPTDAERWRISRDAIEDATTQMRKHVERLRLIRLGIDETNLSVAPVDLARLIEHILIALEPFATQREITLSMNVQSLSARVSGDPQMFEEIFTTLLENAIKHNPPGTVVVRRTLRSGWGVPDAHQRHRQGRECASAGGSVRGGRGRPASGRAPGHRHGALHRQDAD